MAQVRVATGEVNHIMSVRNISLSGVFITSQDLEVGERFAEGQTVELDIFALADLENIRVLGHVTRVHADGPETGYGIEIKEPDGETLDALMALVKLAYKSSIAPPPLPVSS